MGDWFSWEGRLDKAEYTKRALIAILVCAVIGWIPLIGWAIAVALGFTLGCSMARRCRDTDLSPWMGLLVLIPFINLCLAVYLMVR
jgi:uncharacterized membrane protein YhaH (DUF805 family)